MIKELQIISNKEMEIILSQPNIIPTTKGINNLNVGTLVK
jgi:hypothetical protein